MRRSRYSEEQIVGILKEHQAGLSAQDLCRKHGISDATFYIYVRLSRCKRFEQSSRRTWVPTSIRRRQECWRAQMGNPHGREPQQVGGFDESRYKSQVPHAPVTSAGTLL